MVYRENPPLTFESRAHYLATNLSMLVDGESADLDLGLLEHDIARMLNEAGYADCFHHDLHSSMMRIDRESGRITNYYSITCLRYFQRDKSSLVRLETVALGANVKSCDGNLHPDRRALRDRQAKGIYRLCFYSLPDSKKVIKKLLRRFNKKGNFFGIGEDPGMEAMYVEARKRWKKGLQFNKAEEFLAAVLGGN